MSSKGGVKGLLLESDHADPAPGRRRRRTTALTPSWSCSRNRYEPAAARSPAGSGTSPASFASTPGAAGAAPGEGAAA